MSTPFIVHLVFHPRSAAARQAALALHKALNEDPILPGLRIPTLLLPADGTGLPPPLPDLDQAEHSAVIVLADNDMVVEDPVPPGRQGWGAFVADLAERCGDRHRFLPVQLSEAAWPLDPRLETRSFVRAWAEPAETRAAWLERRMVIELCRFLLGRERGEQVPVRIFLSHAKQDINTPPAIFQTLTAHLNATQPVEAWVDSGKIKAGGNFETAIETAIDDCAAVLALATEAYSTRPWCRREIQQAKEPGRPIAVVNGLSGHDLRSFPYLGNVPVMAWSAGGEDSARRTVDLLLKELLRSLHVSRLLERQRRPGECLLTVPPELATVVRHPAGKTILYPDPPLGDEELELLKPLAHCLETPLQRAAADRCLTDRIIALSISESDSLDRVGLFPQHLASALLEISRYLLIKGARLAYGGHLGDAGYTVALFNLVAAHKGHSRLPPMARIINYVGWPLPYLVDDRATYQAHATFVRVPRPDGVEPLSPADFVADPTSSFPADTPERRYAWARGMTAMRQRQTQEVAARIVLGGTIGPTVKAEPDGGTTEKWYASRIPGVVEEALLSLQQDGQPVYLCGGFGGAAALVADLIEGRPVPAEFTWDFHRRAPHAEAMRALYARQGLPWLDYPDMARIFQEIGVAGLARRNGLSEAENRELFRCRDVARIVALLLQGLQNALS